MTGLTLALMPQVAQAQRANENVATQSADAFGRAVGQDRSGLYSSDDVRGFNPVDAGNVRIEGLYFDQVDRLSPRLSDGSTIRVGPAALRYPFPAPTGLVDYSLTQPRGATSYSLNL
ncbi:MAG: TonB-dependent receptor, partial [Novosphingobium sp.]